MKNNKKVSLKEIKVKSFITNLDKKHTINFKGGHSDTGCESQACSAPICNGSDPDIC